MADSIAGRPRLIHLNGVPGVGKSTLARRYADRHPGTLCADIDQLRTMVGGWADDFVGTGEAMRASALAWMTEWLAGGRDAVLPQLIANLPELERFRDAALRGGVDFVEVWLVADPETSTARFWGAASESDLRRVVSDVVISQGGDAALLEVAARLERMYAEPGIGSFHQLTTGAEALADLEALLRRQQEKENTSGSG